MVPPQRLVFVATYAIWLYPFYPPTLTPGTSDKYPGTSSHRTDASETRPPLVPSLTTWQYTAPTLDSASRTHFREAGQAQLRAAISAAIRSPPTTKSSRDSRLCPALPDQQLLHSSQPRRLMWEVVEFDSPRALLSPTPPPFALTTSATPEP